jgi:hypothetical protein
MPQNASEVRVAGTGRVLVAKVGTAMPPIGTDFPAADWKDLGYTSTDGVKFTKKDKVEGVDVWQSLSSVRYVYSDREMTLKFTLMQVNEDTLPFFFGGGQVKAASAGLYTYDIAASPQPDERALAVEFRDGSAITYRFLVPRGMVTETDDLSLTRTAAVKLGVTFSCMAVDDTTPLATWQSNDTAFAAAAGVTED